MKYKMIKPNEDGSVAIFIAKNAKERNALVSIGWKVEK